MSLKFDDLDKKYEGFIRPTVEIDIGGTKLSNETTEIEMLEVQLSTGNEASICQITFGNQYDVSERTFDENMLKKVLKLGNSIEVKLGYINTEPVFKGYIHTVELIFSEDTAPRIYIECLDAKGEMMHGIKSIAYAQKDYIAIVKSILSEYSSVSKVSTSSAIKVEREIQRNNESDYSFICRLGNVLNHEFFILNGECFFRTPAYSSKNPTVVFEQGHLLMRFSLEYTVSRFISKITVKGYDSNEQKGIEATANTFTYVGDGSLKMVNTKTKASKSEMIILDYEIETVDEAKSRAEAELNRRSMSFVKGIGRCIGLPDIVPGKYIEFNKYDETVDNTYYVQRVSHHIKKNYYYTEFEVGANAI